MADATATHGGGNNVYHDVASLLARLNKLQVDTYTAQSAVELEKRIACALEQCTTLLETVYEYDDALQADCAMLDAVDTSSNDGAEGRASPSSCHDDDRATLILPVCPPMPPDVCTKVDADAGIAERKTNHDARVHKQELGVDDEEDREDDSEDEQEDDLTEYVQRWLSTMYRKPGAACQPCSKEAARDTTSLSSRSSSSLRLSGERASGRPNHTPPVEAERDAYTDGSRAATHLLVRSGITTTLTNMRVSTCDTLACYCDRVQTVRHRVDQLTMSVRRSCLRVVRYFAAMRRAAICEARLRHVLSQLDSGNSAVALSFWRDFEAEWSEALCFAFTLSDELLAAQRQRSECNSRILSLLQRPHPVSAWRRVCRDKWYETICATDGYHTRKNS